MVALFKEAIKETYYFDSGKEYVMYEPTIEQQAILPSHTAL